MNIYTYTDGTGIQTVRQIGRQTDLQIGRQTDTAPERQRHRQKTVGLRGLQKSDGTGCYKGYHSVTTRLRYHKTRLLKGLP